MALYLHFVTLKIWIYCKILIACVFPSTGYSSSWFGIMLVMITWEDKCGLTQLWGNALNMNAMGLASQFYRQMQNLCIMVVQLFMCFFNAPEKLQKHKIHRDIDFHLLCLFLMCSQIRSIFRTGDSSVFLLLLLASSSGVWWTDRIPTTSRRIIPGSWLKMTQVSIGHIITISISCGFSCSHVGTRGISRLWCFQMAVVTSLYQHLIQEH